MSRDAFRQAAGLLNVNGTSTWSARRSWVRPGAHAATGGRTRASRPEDECAHPVTKAVRGRLVRRATQPRLGLVLNKRAISEEANSSESVLRSRVMASASPAAIASATAFLRQVLQGDDQPLRDWPQRHAALLARFVTAG